MHREVFGVQGTASTAADSTTATATTAAATPLTSATPTPPTPAPPTPTPPTPAPPTPTPPTVAVSTPSATLPRNLREWRGTDQPPPRVITFDAPPTPAVATPEAPSRSRWSRLVGPALAVIGVLTVVWIADHTGGNTNVTGAANVTNRPNGTGAENVSVALGYPLKFTTSLIDLPPGESCTSFLTSNSRNPLYANVTIVGSTTSSQQMVAVLEAAPTAPPTIMSCNGTSYYYQSSVTVLGARDPSVGGWGSNGKLPLHTTCADFCILPNLDSMYYGFNANVACPDITFRTVSNFAFFFVASPGTYTSSVWPNQPATPAFSFLTDAALPTITCSEL